MCFVFYATTQKNAWEQCLEAQQGNPTCGLKYRESEYKETTLRILPTLQALVSGRSWAIDKNVAN